ncbi:DNA-directed RNA polymerase II subunit RPB2 [Galdieria sulphuraria]|nr:DNA-directed RNA polymerase II subunit RPB2 [Galdieria sulphuraria]
MDLKDYYFKIGGPLRWLFDSFEQFVEKVIPSTVSERVFLLLNGSTARFSVREIKKPSISPLSAREQKLTYSIEIVLDCFVDDQIEVTRSFFFPCLVKSKYCIASEKTFECQSDPGGYFILDGVEYFVLNIEKLRLSFPICTADKAGNPKVYYSSRSNRGSAVTWVSLDLKTMVLQVKVWSFPGTRALNFFALWDAEEWESFVVPFARKFATPLSLLSLETLWETSKELERTKLLAEAFGVSCSQEGLLEKFWESTFPGCQENRKKETLVFMAVRCLQLYCEELRHDDTNNWGFKRLETVGSLCQQIFVKIWNRELDASFVKSFQSGGSITPNHRFLKKICFDSLSEKLCSVRNWNLGANVDILHREAPLSFYAQLTRVSSGANRRSKGMKIRMVHPSQIGFLCIHETPEGESCGLVKSLACTCYVTSFSTLPGSLVEFAADRVKDDGDWMVFVNGMYQGFIDDCQMEEFVGFFRQLRRKEEISPFASVVHRKRPKKGEIHLSDDDGRVCRPLLEPFEFIDAMEQHYSTVVSQQRCLTKYDCCGFAAATIPYLFHNQAPRLTYQCSMGRQALSSFHSFLDHRFDSTIRVLHRAEKPLVRTSLYDALNLGNMPAGVNVFVMIATWKGWNQEDAIIVNEDLIEKKKLFHFDVIHHYECVSLVGKKFSEEVSWIAPTGTYLKENDLIAEKKRKWYANGLVENIGIRVSIGEEGCVEKIFQCKGQYGEKIYRIRLVHHRKLQVGDKLASRYAQKGVVGKIFPSHELPYFGPEKIRPDLIINPHSIPSRMTVGQLLEMIEAFAIYHGWDHGSEDSMHCFLRKKGYDPYLYEEVFHPNTGQYIGKAQVGICYYQLLRHLVLDKFQCRGTGRVHSLTKQPVHGRSMSGGLRLGEMELRAIASHGAWMFLRDRVCVNSDGFPFEICATCKRSGFLRSFADDDGEPVQFVCSYCGVHNDNRRYFKATLPYTFHYFKHLLAGMNIELGLS